MKEGDKVIVVKDIKLCTGTVYPVGSIGTIIEVPRAEEFKKFVHLRMEDSGRRVLLLKRQVRLDLTWGNNHIYPYLLRVGVFISIRMIIKTTY
ncbi:MAG: hypothetical protein WBD99_00065 [Thermodesulfobacteriota bacterium]